jgi:MerR family transcriptional regulator, thiopeptide resistance regulator
MTQALPIDDVVRLTGLTSRALRFYEARGLVAPLRTAAGRRLYGAAELTRVHQIVALKKAGLTLAQMQKLFDNRPIALADLLRSQLAALTEQSAALDRAKATLQTALSRLESGAPLDVATLCALIKDGDCAMDYETQWKPIIDKYWSPEAQAEWIQQTAPLAHAKDDHDQAAYWMQWRDLSDKITNAMPLDPASDTALGFVREWFTLLEPFSKVATPTMWEASRTMYADMDNWPTNADAGFSKAVWDFIGEATEAARAAGKDIGPAPAWMTVRSTNIN